MKRVAFFALALAAAGCPRAETEAPPPATSVSVPEAPPAALGARAAGSRAAEEDRLGQRRRGTPDPTEDPDAVDPLAPLVPRRPLADDGGVAL